MIKIIDNFIPKHYQHELEGVFCGDNFLWTYQPCTYKPYTGTDDRICDVPFLGRKVFGGNTPPIPEYIVVKPLMYFFMEHTGMEISNVGRIKANLMLTKDDKRWHPPHRDAEHDNYYTLLYYVNDCDGDTLFFDGSDYNIVQRVTPKKGRAVIFPSNMLHCGNNPTKSCKVTLNCVILTK